MGVSAKIDRRMTKTGSILIESDDARKPLTQPLLLISPS